jgi:hypothetical protein
MVHLSQHLRETLRQMDEDFIRDTPPDERQETVEWLASRMTAYLLESLEGFSDRAAVGLAATFDLRLAGMNEFFEDLFDEHYTRNLLERIPKMVKRTMRLSRMMPRKIPSSATNLFLREATRNYVFGLWQGSVALSRAAVEQGLREEVGAKVSLRGAKFYDLVSGAIRLRLLDDDHGRLASMVEHAGNRVLHGKPSGDRESWETLDSARKVLVHLYGKRKK